MSELTAFQRRVIEVVAALGEGEVVSYGDVAHDAGNPAAARAVGALLARSMDGLPWWRVVYSDGRLPPCDPPEQAARLRAEGVEVRNGRVVVSSRRLGGPLGPARTRGGSG